MKPKRVSKRSASSRPSKTKSDVAIPKTKPGGRSSLPSKLNVTFTVRDLGRQTQTVLSAVDNLGSARVLGRSGKKYVIRPESETEESAVSRAQFRQRLASLRAQIREAGDGFTAQGWETISKAIAGE